MDPGLRTFGLNADIDRTLPDSIPVLNIVM